VYFFVNSVEYFQSFHLLDILPGEYLYIYENIFFIAFIYFMTGGIGYFYLFGDESREEIFKFYLILNDEHG